MTITAHNNDVDAPNKTVRVSGSASNSQGVTDPADVTLTITDDDTAPTVTLELSADFHQRERRLHDGDGAVGPGVE